MKKHKLTVLVHYTVAVLLMLWAFLLLWIFASPSIGYSQDTYTAIKAESPPTIDGNVAEFSSVTSIVLSNSGGTVGTYQFMWDSTALYIAATVADAELNAAGVDRDAALYLDDSIELFFDTLNNDGQSRQVDDNKFFVNVLNVQADSRGVGGSAAWNANFVSAVTIAGTVNTGGDFDTGYTIEIAIPWSEWGITPPEDGVIFGFDLGMNDRLDNGTRTQTFWSGTAGDANNPSGWGKMLFSQPEVSPWPGPLSGVVGVAAVWEIIEPPTTIDVTLAWDASNGADGYRMFYREAGYEYTYEAPDWEGPSTTCVLLGLPRNKDLYFVVRAYNEFGPSEDSNEVFLEGGS